MALIVEVKINRETIIRTVAQRISGNPSETCTYQVDGADLLTHHYDEGAEVLAIKLLQRLQVRRKGA